MKMLWLALFVSSTVIAAEVVFTPEELQDITGPAGPAGPQGEPGLDGTRITELAGICTVDIGGEVFELACTPAGTVPEPEPPTEPPVGGCFDGCQAFGAGNYECPDQQLDVCWQDEYTERQGPGGWWIYEPGHGEPTEPPIEPEPPVDPPVEPPVEPEPPVVEPPTAQCGSPYRGIPDPCAHLGFDIYAQYEADQVLTGPQAQAHLSGAGTAADPFVIDASGATFEKLTLAGQYVILQGATVNAPGGSGPMIALGGHEVSCSHCVVRDVTLSGPKIDSSHSAAVGLGSDNAWLRGSIHGFGDNRVEAAEQDFHGIKVMGSDVWILDAEIYDVSGDSVQVGDASRGAGERVYIGGGYFHHNRENGVDIKDSRNVVVSGVRMSGFRPTASSGGVALVIHDDAFDARIFDNVISDSNIGIVSSGMSGHVIDGNTVQAILIGIQCRNTGNITISNNDVTAPTPIENNCD